MNIFVISRGYPNIKKPLWGSFEALQAKALKELGHSVVILSVGGRYNLQDRKCGIVYSNADGLDVYIYYRLFPLKILKFSRKLCEWVKHKRLKSLLRRVVEKQGMPHIIYAHYLFNMENIMMVKEHYNVPLVGIEHWSELMKPVIRPSVYNAASRAYCAFDKILAVSPSLCSVIKNEFGITAEFVPNMVDNDFISAGVSQGSGRKRFEFVSVGRLVDWKRFDNLIKAADHLRNAGYGFHVTIVGGGSEYEKLRKMIVDLQLKDIVNLLGQKNKEEIIKNLHKADAFVLASDHETFGVVYIEAMAMGLPVIACNIGGPTHFVNESNGMLIPPKDPIALAKAMEKMMKNKESYKKDNIAKYCYDNFSSYKVALQLEKIFEDVIAQKTMKNS